MGAVTWAIACATLIATAGLGGCQGSEGQVFAPFSSSDLGQPGAGGGAAEAASGAGGSGGDGVVAIGDEPFLNENTHFQWEETVPGAGGCQTGRYSGRFTCPPSSNNLGMSGTINFTLDGSAEDQLLIIIAGETAVFRTDITGSVWSAGLEGSLNCVTDVFEATAKDAVASDVLAGIPVLPFLTMGVPFTANLDGSVNKEISRVQGAFRMNTSGGDCDGTFSANWTP